MQWLLTLMLWHCQQATLIAVAKHNAPVGDLNAHARSIEIHGKLCCAKGTPLAKQTMLLPSGLQRFRQVLQALAPYTCVLGVYAQH